MAGGPVRSLDGLSGQVIPALEGSATQAYKVGDLVQFETAGRIIVATAGSISGIATTKAKGTADTVTSVELLSPDKVYIAYYKASAITQALIGDCLDFVFDVGAHYLDESSATTDVYCVGLYDPVGTVGGRLLVRFYGTLFTASAT